MKVLLLSLMLAFGVQDSDQKPASVEGVVLQTGSGKPVPDAAVELSLTRGEDAPKYTASVAADGRFTLKAIPPGEYRLAATSRGYVRAEYGQRGPNGRGLPIQLLPGEEKKDARISLTATGAISGRIRDANGAPLTNVQVMALRYIYQGGRKTLSPAKAVITDDLGEYRLYWLPPQKYMVVAMPLRGELGDYFISASGADYTISNYIKPPTGVPILPDSSAPALPLYFPGATNPDSASAVNVEPGGDVRGIDIAMRVHRTSRR